MDPKNPLPSSSDRPIPGPRPGDVSSLDPIGQGPSGDWLYPGSETEPSRRSFLRMAGYGLASASFAGCSRAPVGKVIPLLEGSESIIAGRAYWVATTCGGCSASCGVLARCLDGRPVKVEGNAKHGLSKGGLCATGQAEILSVYDSKRLAHPVQQGSTTDWATVDTAIRERLAELNASNGRVRVLTGSVHSPSTRATIARFVEAQVDAKHVSYDALSASALLDAHEQTHGKRAIPAYRFDRARTIVSFSADFLGTWISPVQFAADYAAGRKPDSAKGDGQGHMSHHVQFEAVMSLTGAAADVRTRVAPWEEPAAVAALCRFLEHHAGSPSRLGKAPSVGPHDKRIRLAADALWDTRGHSLVVCGSNDLQTQILVVYANELLGNYGETLSLARPSKQLSGSDGDWLDLKAELESGEVGMLIVSGVNPAYELPGGVDAALRSAGTLVVHSDGQDETSTLAHYRLPSSHPLESWSDGEPEVGRFDLRQPTVPAIRAGRTLRQLLSTWLGDTRGDRELLADHWSSADIAGQCGQGAGSFERFFEKSLHDGFVEATLETSEPHFDVAAVTAPVTVEGSTGLGLVLYPKVSMRAGAHAHNPWLQELPDPVSKITWDNYASLSPGRAEDLGLEAGDIVRVSTEESPKGIELPVHIQRGQHDDVVAVALGYGRRGTDRFQGVGPDWLEAEPTIVAGETLGANAAPLLTVAAGRVSYVQRGAILHATGTSRGLASTQDHHTLEVPANLAPRRGEVRDAVQSVGFDDYTEHPDHAVHAHHPPDTDLWTQDHEKLRHHWGMSVDLSSCIGCSACMVSCQAENNVPVVGRDEVARHREMHWMRIDRYLEGEGDDVSAAYQPMFCQQCDNAPCEGVCPVLATVHSSEGLNQQVYNRCVGTRYCANTCPYKVRRFNWFEYPREDELANQALNPDVTVRSRGVMEKCSFCAQRIQEAKSEAARTGQDIQDGDIQVACQQSCPTSAIVFGDMNDPQSKVSNLMARQRSYGVLTELNVKPSVRYLARVRNNKHGDQDHG